MTEDLWVNHAAPRQMLAFLEGKVSERKVYLVEVACYYRVWDVIEKTRSRDLVPVVRAMEQLADGHISFEDYRTLRERIYTSRYPPPRKVTPRLAVRSVVQAEELSADRITERRIQATLLHCIFGNPFRPVATDPSWLTSTVTALARGIYDDRAFDRLPILADALQDAGCDHADILAHCRGRGPHARGCWVVDLILGLS